MNFATFFILLVLLAMISPTQFVMVGKNLISAVYPVVEAGMPLAIMIAVVLFLFGKL